MDNTIKVKNNMEQILIVEDSLTQAEKLKHLLEKNKYNVIVANNGRNAITQISMRKPSLVISDIIMPEMNGFELCKKIKSDEKNCDIPVILLTSLSNSDDVLEGLACGADNFLTKPYNDEYLLSHIGQILANKKIYSGEIIRVGVEIVLGGKKRFITSSQQQMLTLLISTYEAAVHKNKELLNTQNELRSLNEHLEDIVESRTKELTLEIDSRKKTEKALSQAAEEWLSTFNSSPDAISIIDSSHRIIQSNQAMKDLTNSQDGDLIHEKCFEKVHGLCYPIEDCPLEKAFKSKKRETFEMEQNNQSFEIIVDPILNDKNEIINFNHIIRDVTNRKKIEKKLKNSEQQYRFITEKISDVVWLMDLNGKSIFVSPSIENFTGYTVDEYLAQSINDRFTSESAIFAVTLLKEEVAKYSLAVDLLQDYTKMVELNYKCKDGSIKTGELLITPYFDEYHKLGGIHGVTRDITERKLAENLLKKSEDKFRNLVETTNDIIWETANGIFTYISPKVESILGYRQEELIGLSPFELMPLDEAKKIEEISNKITASKKPFNGLININIHKNGQSVILETSGVPILNANNELLGYRGINRDITERKKADELIIESEEKYRNLFNLISDAIFVLDKETRKIYEVNQATYNMYGYSKDELLQMNGEDVSAEPEETNYAINTAQRNIPLRKHKRKDGSIFHVEINSSQIYYKDRICILATIHDISVQQSQLKLIKQLNQNLSEKNYELEQLIYLTSHDLRSPLVNIKGFSDELNISFKKLIEVLPDNLATTENTDEINNLTVKEIPESIFYITQSCRKMNSLIEGLLKVARFGKLEITKHPLNMNHLIAEILSYYEFLIKEKNIEITLENLPDCLADENLLNQVISNLIDNAIKFMSDNAIKQIKISGVVKNRNSIYCIEDNGKGICEKFQKNIFIIFQKENENIQGEGLGLTIAAKIIEKHNGKIWVKSELNKGSKFYIKLKNHNINEN